jgi:hypothetical protein
MIRYLFSTDPDWCDPIIWAPSSSLVAPKKSPPAHARLSFGKLLVKEEP